MAVEPLRLADQADGVGVDHDRSRRGQREGQHLRHVAQARARPGCSRCARPEGRRRRSGRSTRAGRRSAARSRPGHSRRRSWRRPKPPAQSRPASARQGNEPARGCIYGLAGRAAASPAGRSRTSPSPHRCRYRPAPPGPCCAMAGISRCAGFSAPKVTVRSYCPIGESSAPSSVATPLGRSQATATSALSINSKSR